MKDRLFSEGPSCERAAGNVSESEGAREIDIASVIARVIGHVVGLADLLSLAILVCRLLAIVHCSLAEHVIVRVIVRVQVSCLRR